jgi:hypothetical protein
MAGPVPGTRGAKTRHHTRAAAADTAIAAHRAASSPASKGRMAAVSAPNSATPSAGSVLRQGHPA